MEGNEIVAAVVHDLFAEYRELVMADMYPGFSLDVYPEVYEKEYGVSAFEVAYFTHSKKDILEDMFKKD